MYLSTGNSEYATWSKVPQKETNASFHFILTLTALQCQEDVLY